MRDALLEICGLDYSIGENSQSGKLGYREICGETVESAACPGIWSKSIPDKMIHPTMSRAAKIFFRMHPDHPSNDETCQGSLKPIDDSKLFRIYWHKWLPFSLRSFPKASRIAVKK